LASRIGVDIGGTFTDFILYSEKDNSITIDKIPTTPKEPQKAVIEVVKRNLDKVDIKEIEFLINSYENWYDTFDKDGYKYVIDQLNFDQKYYNQLLSSLHNFVKGGEFYPIKIK